MKPRNKNAKAQTHEKPELTAAPPNPPAPTPEQIQKRAYEMFTARGGEPGHELDDWLLAEYELKAEIGRQRENPAQ